MEALEEDLRRHRRNVCKRQRRFPVFREDKARVLVERIDDAIEQAETLELSFVVGILMMARLEAVQTGQIEAAGREKKRVS
jgi:hypothetical protein